MNRLTATLALLIFLLAGCTEGNSYGSKKILEGTDGTQPRLGGPSSTLPPPTAAPAPTTEPPSPVTTRRAPPTTSAKPREGFPIAIQSDQANTQFDPRVAQVFAGATITWTNTDSVARSVEFADQSYLSGPIPPGGSATLTTARSGEFNYSDGSRPYAVGTLRVLPR